MLALRQSVEGAHCQPILFHTWVSRVLITARFVLCLNKNSITWMINCGSDHLGDPFLDSKNISYIFHYFLPCFYQNSLKGIGSHDVVERMNICGMGFCFFSLFFLCPHDPMYDVKWIIKGGMGPVWGVISGEQTPSRRHSRGLYWWRHYWVLMCYYAPMHQGRPVQKKGLPTHYVWHHLGGTSALKTALSRPPPSFLSSNVSGNWSRFNNKLTALWTVLWGEEIASLSAAKEGGLRQKNEKFIDFYLWSWN